MKAGRIGAAKDANASLPPLVRRVGQGLAYFGVFASTLSAYRGTFTSFNVLSCFYLIALLGVIACLRRAQFDRTLREIAYVFAGFYVVLFAIELSHGGPFHYPLPRGANYLTEYFPLLAFPFFVVGLRESQVDLRGFDYAGIATAVFTAGLVLYQLLVEGDPRPRGWSLNPVPFAFIMQVWTLYLLCRALRTDRVDLVNVTGALVSLVPLILSGSKVGWVLALIGNGVTLVVWGRATGKWRQAGAIAGAIAVLAALLWQIADIRQRFVDLAADAGSLVSSGSTSGASVGLRFVTTVSGSLAFLSQPLFGYGMAATKSAGLEHRPADFSSFTMLPHLHDEYVTHMVAFGIAGLLFTIALVAAFVIGSWRRSDLTMRHFGVTAGLLLALYMGVEVVFTQPEIYGLVFFIFGIVLSLPEKRETSRLPAGAAPQAAETVS